MQACRGARPAIASSRRRPFCPTCGAEVEAGKARKLRRLPWHLLLLLGVLAVYLGYRLIQGIAWLVEQL